jgi:hypothetical protein
MSVDRRIRDGLLRSVPSIEPETGPIFERVLARSRRLRTVRRAAIVVATAAAVIAVTVLSPAVLDILKTERPQPLEPSGPTSVVGTYRVDLTGSADPALDEQDLAGAWQFALQADGLVIVQVPPDATIGPSRLTYQFQLDDRRMITNLFANDLCVGSASATYQVQRVGDALALTVVEDDCAIRIAILTTVPWAPV